MCDFGVSTRLLDGATHRSTTSLGTITHMAPEGECGVLLLDEDVANCGCTLGRCLLAWLDAGVASWSFVPHAWQPTCCAWS